ncbi:MAG: adenylosuccinate lyase [Bacillota bacterium]
MIGRYTRPPMRELWSEENKYRTWLEVEILAAEAWAQLGEIPPEAPGLIRQKARVDPARIAQIEAEVKHDVIAFVSAVAETVGEYGKYVHYGLTSYDVVDTALAVLTIRATDMVLEGARALAESLKGAARKYKLTPMIGRTHGVHAEPITLGLKFAVWYQETLRNIDRLEHARENVRVGKLSGAVGTYAHVPPFVEEYVCEKLGLKPAPASTQVVQRDRHAELVCALAQLATSIEKFATEVRALQRTEIGELEEPFAKGQKGSSAMPHKRNPVVCEQLCGLARVMRGYALAAMENQVLWGERDISNSSVERIVLVDATTLADYMVSRFAWVIDNLRVRQERLRENLELTKGLVFSEDLLLALIKKGLQREEAYSWVQGLAMDAWEKGGDFKAMVLQDLRIRSLLSQEEIEACFAPENHFKWVDMIFKRCGIQK